VIAKFMISLVSSSISNGIEYNGNDAQTGQIMLRCIHFDDMTSEKMQQNNNVVLAILRFLFDDTINIGHSSSDSHEVTLG
jgi:hypothetical protein